MQFALNKLRNAARVLLTLDEKDPKRIFEGEAIMRRMYRYSLLVRSRFPFDNHFDFWIFGGEHEASASLGPVCRPLASRGIGLGSGARTLRIGEKRIRLADRHATSLSLAQQDESQDKLDYVLALTPEIFLERRLQTIVFKLGLAKSVHHARVLIKQRHIRVGKQIVNIPPSSCVLTARSTSTIRSTLLSVAAALAASSARGWRLPVGVVVMVRRRTSKHPS